MKNLKLLFVFTVLLAVCFGCKKKEPIGFAELREITKKRDLHLVEYRYHDMIFLHKKDNPNKKLRMIVKYPVTIAAYVDLKQMEIDSMKKKITLPYPDLRDANVRFDEAEFIKVRDGMLLSFGGAREEMLELLKGRMKESQDRIAKNATDLGIRDQAKTETEAFIKDLLASMGLNGFTIDFKKSDSVAAIVNTPDEFLESTKNIVEENYLEIDEQLEELIGD